MVYLIEYQLKQSLLNIKSARKVIDKENEKHNDDMLENYHIELYDVELRLEDMLKHLNKIEKFFQGGE